MQNTGKELEKVNIMVELVSILSPIFNAKRFLHRNLTSIMSQAYDGIEAILGNDGSTDKTDDIIREYKGQFGYRGIHEAFLLAKV